VDKLAFPPRRRRVQMKKKTILWEGPGGGGAATRREHTGRGAKAQERKPRPGLGRSCVV